MTISAYVLSPLVLSLILAIGCASSVVQEDDPPEDIPSGAKADVISVSVSGPSEAYQFSVGIRSPDTGCELYANWWEVISPEGVLLYRRILAHSHVNEQPFVRSGGPITITPDDEVIIRAYMHPDGYGGQVYRGSVASGFQADSLSDEFAADLSEQDPLPTGCTG